MQETERKNHVDCLVKPKRYERHGEYRTRLYTTWTNMRSRCHRRGSTQFHKYGAMGVSVCVEWRSSFVAFRDWAKSSGYEDGLSLDRIDSKGNYEPTNCRWATPFQQSANTRVRRSNKTSKFKGVSFVPRVKKWRATMQTHGQQKHLGYFDTEEAAAKAYDAESLAIHGEYACLNFKR